MLVEADYAISYFDILNGNPAHGIQQEDLGARRERVPTRQVAPLRKNGLDGHGLSLCYGPISVGWSWCPVLLCGTLVWLLVWLSVCGTLMWVTLLCVLVWLSSCGTLVWALS